MDNCLNRSLTNSQIYDGEFFDVVGQEGDILIVRCNICTPDGTDAQLLRTSVKSNGNILKHIKRRHIDMLEKIKSTKSVKSRAPRTIKREHGMEEMVKPFKKKMVQIKVKKSTDNEMEENDTQVFITNDEQDSYNTGNDMYLIEPMESTESDGEEYVELELDNNQLDESQSVEENSSLHHEYEYIRKPVTTKRLRESSTYEGTPSYKRPQIDRSLLEFQKKLMQMEFDDMKKLRHEKHQLEIAILKAELTHKTLEHQKQMEIMNKKIQD
ncbi:uncharacterized protein LOC116349078 [Contarinia nasturtii]|uniref:uncharacterized protein LOC116349078 n=1 Tax=Contarinia nasturtii TaxID=265458 RepID=UPI0012D45851|nr:uncharacterized protein LOC116349078 [Contarinia nasturtii]